MKRVSNYESGSIRLSGSSQTNTTAKPFAMNCNYSKAQLPEPKLRVISEEEIKALRVEGGYKLIIP